MGLFSQKNYDINLRYLVRNDNRYVLQDEALSVFQSVDAILTTPRPTRLFRPDFGGDPEFLLFEIIDETTALRILDRVTRLINRWEPRVIFNPNLSQVIPDPDNYRYELHLYLVMRLSGRVVVYTRFLELQREA